MTAQTQHISAPQAVQLSQTHTILIWTLFIAGYLIHALLQIDAVARAKNNPINSRWHVIAQNWPRLLARFFVSGIGFWILWANGSAFPSFLGYFGITLSPTAVSIVSLPMTPAIAGMWGFFVDSALAYVPFLKNAIPPVELVQMSVTQHTEIDTTVQKTVPVSAPPANGGK